MNTDFTNLTTENLSNEHLCCIIRSKKSHPGIEAKRQWLSDRLNEGHVFRKLNAKATVFIEYAPLETAWVPVIGDNYYYLYCLWVLALCLVFHQIAKGYFQIVFYHDIFFIDNLCLHTNFSHHLSIKQVYNAVGITGIML